VARLSQEKEDDQDDEEEGEQRVNFTSSTEARWNRRGRRCTCRSTDAGSWLRNNGSAREPVGDFHGIGSRLLLHRQMKPASAEPGHVWLLLDVVENFAEVAEAHGRPLR